MVKKKNAVESAFIFVLLVIFVLVGKWMKKETNKKEYKNILT